MIALRQNKPLLAILLTGLLIRLWLWSWGPTALFRCGILLDDGYYAFSFARELAAGHLFQLAPGQISNGYQPLWVFLIAPFFAIFPNNPDWPLLTALLLAIFMSIATAALLSSWARRLGFGNASLAAAALWMFSPTVIVNNLNGLETSLNAMLIAALGAFWPTLTRRPLILGTLLGLQVLARIDNLLLVPFLISLALWDLHTTTKNSPEFVGRVCNPTSLADSTKPHHPFSHFPKYALQLSIPILLFLIPYACLSYNFTGAVLPQSGKAMRQISLLYFGAPPAPSFPWHIIRAHFAAIADTFWIEGYLHLTPVDPSWPLALRLILMTCMIALLAPHLAALRRCTALPLRWWFPLCPLALLIVAYATFQGGSWFFARYFHPTLLLVSLALSYLLSTQSTRSPRITRSLLLAFFILHAFLSLLYLDTRRASVDFFTPHLRPLVDQYIAEGGRVGMFQSGLMGYMTHGAVVNLDGVVNPGAMAALEAGDLDRYIARERITTVIDWPWVLDTLYYPRSQTGKPPGMPRQLGDFLIWNTDTHESK